MSNRHVDKEEQEAQILKKMSWFYLAYCKCSISSVVFFTVERKRKNGAFWETLVAQLESVPRDSLDTCKSKT